ncbi:hypothetical protein BLM14_20405 (plasmid) [Phyllobacterium zundukense]|nr:hypothetical protein BLM14_20405 [Phyllobacterium zundukense]
MRTAIETLGTRGDVQPYIALAEFASAAAKTRTGDANISIIGKPSTLPLSFLGGPQSLRPASDKTHRPCTPPASHERACTLEVRHRYYRLKSGIHQA